MLNGRRLSKVHPNWQTVNWNVKMGDIIVLDSNQTRGHWKLARVSNVFQADGLVRHAGNGSIKKNSHLII